MITYFVPTAALLSLPLYELIQVRDAKVFRDRPELLSKKRSTIVVKYFVTGWNFGLDTLPCVVVTNAGINLYMVHI